MQSNTNHQMFRLRCPSHIPDHLHVKCSDHDDAFLFTIKMRYLGMRRFQVVVTGHGMINIYLGEIQGIENVAMVENS